MPDMDGYEVCRQLKAMPDHGTIPVIFLSGLDDVHDKVTAFASGGVDYITKPVEAQEVLVRVQTHLAIRSAEAEIRRLNTQLEDRLQQRTQQLSDTVYRLEQEVARRQQTEQILQTAKNAAEAANRAKNEFLANMSHELRTPLHIILSYANFGLNRTHLSLNKIQTYFQHIDQHGRTLLHLLDALLDLGQLDAKQLALYCEYEDLKTVIQVIIDEFQPLLSHHQLHLQHDLPDTPIVTYFDTKGIKQVLRHLLRRCLKSLMLGNPSYHQVSHGDVNHRLAALREELIILVQSPVFVQPTECPLHAPPFGQNHKPFHVVGGLDNLETNLAIASKRG